MRLVPPDEKRLHTLFGWFDDDHSVTIWGGPDMRLPMTFESFKVDAMLDTQAGRFLLDHTDTTVGFGQYYERADHCHLGRLVIAPDQRGKRLGETLIEELAAEGARALNIARQSLFVFSDNTSARKLYERLGFRDSVYPYTDVPLTGIDYMVRTALPG